MILIKGSPDQEKIIHLREHIRISEDSSNYYVGLSRVARAIAFTILFLFLATVFTLLWTGNVNAQDVYVELQQSDSTHAAWILAPGDSLFVILTPTGLAPVWRHVADAETNYKTTSDVVRVSSGFDDETLPLIGKGFLDINLWFDLYIKPKE
jgi:hypothetical protein